MSLKWRLVLAECYASLSEDLCAASIHAVFQLVYHFHDTRLNNFDCTSQTRTAV